MTTASQRYFHVIPSTPVRAVAPRAHAGAQPWQANDRPWQAATTAPSAVHESQRPYGYRVPAGYGDTMQQSSPKRARLRVRPLLSVLAGVIAVTAALAAAFLGLFGGLLSAPSIVAWVIALVSIGAALALATSGLVEARRDGKRSTTAALGLIFSGLAVLVSVIDLVVQLLIGMR